VQFALQDPGEVRDRVAAIAVAPDETRGSTQSVDAVTFEIVDDQFAANFFDAEIHITCVWEHAASSIALLRVAGERDPLREKARDVRRDMV